MTPLLQQRSGRPLSVACAAKLATFEAVEISVRRKEAVSPLIPGNDSSSSIFYLDDVRLRHV
jgi:hypothetical protein